MTDGAVIVPRLETERLILRVNRMEDFEPYAAFCASPRAAMRGGIRNRLEAFRALASEIGHWQLRGYGWWGIEEKATGAYAGQVGLYYPEGWPEPELGWLVMDGFEGWGIAHEAALRVLRYAYETLGWTRLASCIRPGNTRSIRLAERLGATFDRDDLIAGEIPCRVYLHPGPAA
jgi:RimJ/RimL family protein N-acetyltransferase